MNPSITPRLKSRDIDKGHTEPPPSIRGRRNEKTILEAPTLIRAIQRSDSKFLSQSLKGNGAVLRRECMKFTPFSPKPCTLEAVRQSVILRQSRRISSKITGFFASFHFAQNDSLSQNWVCRTAPLARRAGFTFLILSIIICGCSYPHYQLQKLDDATFNDKRCDKKALNIQEFIRPEETDNFLKQIQRQIFSPDSEINTVLNILYYAQQIKNTKESKEFWQYPGETLQKGGDCEDKTFLLLSALIKAGINDASGVKGRYLGQGHMWVEYKGYILDPSHKTTKLLPVKKSIGYVPYFKFDKDNIYFCATAKGE